MLELKVNGMTCGGCASSVTRAIKNLDATATVTVDLATKLVKVNTEQAKTDQKNFVTAIEDAVRDAGFEVESTKIIR